MSLPSCLLVAALVAATVLASASAELIDLTYTYNVDAPTSPRLTPFRQDLIRKGRNKLKIWVELYEMCASEHSGTHIDAPRHHDEDGWTVEDIPLDRLWRVPAVVVDVSKMITSTRLKNYEVKVADLEKWDEDHGPIPDGAIVFIRTGWSSMVNNTFKYAGLDHNNQLNFPGLGKGAAEWLAKYGRNNDTGDAIKGIVGVGIDTLSLDKGQSQRMPAHVALFAANIYGIENVANLEKLDTTGSIVTVLPMRIGGGTGAPARVVAEVGEDEAMDAAHAAHPFVLLLLLPAALAARFFVGV